jgi:glucan 1,3-beta-glucosidase
MIQPDKKMYGVNLGGWFVLEWWMSPYLFEGVQGHDETRFCEQLGPEAEKRLRQHWETFITAEDLDWLVGHGINTVRLPIGHWLFGDRKPYIGSIHVLDEVMRQIAERGLDVILDLHTAPGCQNGFDNGGIEGVMEWHRHPENIDLTLETIGRIAEHYRDHSTLVGIELLNEPHHQIDINIVQDYYLRGYERVRKFISPEKAAVVIHDSFRSRSWQDFMQPPHYENVILDTHIYQCFKERDRALDAWGHLELAAVEHRQELDEVQQQLPAIVGEWSLGLPGHALENLDAWNQSLLLRAYGTAQLLNYNRCRGWFFWNYRVRNPDYPGWDYRTTIERGWLVTPEPHDS